MAYSEPMKARLRFIEESLKEIYAANSSVILVRALNSLGDLNENEREMTPADIQFIRDIYGLLGRRRAFTDKIPSAHLCAGITGCLVFLFLSLAPEYVVALCTFASYIISVSLWGVYHFAFSEMRPDGRASLGKWDGVGMGILAFGYGWARVMARHRVLIGATLFSVVNLLHSIFGISLGLTISYGISSHILRGYLKKMINTCETYCAEVGRQSMKNFS